MSWKNNQNVLNPSMNQGSVENKPDWIEALTEAMTKMAQTQNQFLADNQKFVVETRTSIRNLEHQMGQMAEKLNALIPGKLPSNTLINPRECNAITVRSEEQEQDEEERGLEKVLVD